MPRVVALYRYPVKGFAPEARDSLTVLGEGRIAGDRVLGFRFADSAAPDGAWTRKHEMVALVNTPGLARLEARFDAAAMRLRLALDGAALADYVLGLPENPLTGRPERLPLRLVGDGVTPRHQDNEQGQATLHSRETLAAVAVAAGEPALDEARFRTNIVIDGVRPWEELDWLGRHVRVGEVEFEVARHKTRCLATHANPASGERDVPMMPLLMKRFGQKQPTFAVGMVARGAGGRVRVGDEVAPG